jgi:hypothetical protein
MSKEQIQQLLSDPEVARILQPQNTITKAVAKHSQEYNLTTEGHEDVNFLGY